MKAEAYLKENRFQSMKYSGYDVCYNDALEAVSMARIEERERTYKHLEFVLDEWINSSDVELFLSDFKSSLEAI